MLRRAKHSTVEVVAPKGEEEEEEEQEQEQDQEEEFLPKKPYPD